MNIIIRSQDRFNLLSPVEIYVGGTSTIFANTGGCEGKIGEYDTPNQSMWVMDKIQEEIKKGSAVYDMPSIEEVEMRMNK